jgi:putative transposase
MATSSKTVLTEDGEIEIAIPRDRAGSFEPQLIGKGQTRFDGFDDKILSLYARGITVREIQGHLGRVPINLRRDATNAMSALPP